MAFDQFVSWNPGGFGSVSKAIKTEKLFAIKNYLLHPQKLNVLCLVETQLFEKNKLPKYLSNIHTIFAIPLHQLPTHIEGRLLYVQVKYISDTTQNFFFYYGSHANQAEREQHIDIAQNYITNNTLEEIFFLGHFNCITSNLDTNQSSINFQALTQNWLVFEQNNSIFDTFRIRCQKRTPLLKYRYK